MMQQLKRLSMPSKSKKRVKFPNTCEDVVKCLLGVSSTDLFILKTFKNKDITADEIINKVEKDKSTICRSLKRIIECGMAEKTKVSIEGGGYYYKYHIHDTKELKEIISNCAEDLKNNIESTIKELDNF